MKACTHPYIIRTIMHPRPDIAVLRMVPEKGPGLSWLAGQYALIETERHEARPFSIANAPFEAPELEIHIRDPGRGGLGNWLVSHSRVGDAVRISDAIGQTVLPPLADTSLLFIAGGLGITPVKALIEQALQDKEARQVSLVWGARNGDDLYLDYYFRTLARQNPRFDYASATDETAVACAIRLHPDLGDRYIFVSGPEAMIVATVPLLIQHGAHAGRICHDPLVSAPVPDLLDGNVIP